jgi:hypothetical protein
MARAPKPPKLSKRRPRQAEDTGADIPTLTSTAIGWVPRDQFTGPPEQWKPEINSSLMGATSSATQLPGSRRSRASSTSQRPAPASSSNRSMSAFELTAHATCRGRRGWGRRPEALKISRTIDTTLRSGHAQPPGPSPEAQAFAERNSSWFQKPGNEYATARAIEIATRSPPRATRTTGRSSHRRAAAEAGNAAAVQGRHERTRKDPPGVNAPGSRGALLRAIARRASATCPRKPRTSLAT